MAASEEAAVAVACGIAIGTCCSLLLAISGGDSLCSSTRSRQLCRPVVQLRQIGCVGERRQLLLLVRRGGTGDCSAFAVDEVFVARHAFSSFAARGEGERTNLFSYLEIFLFLSGAGSRGSTKICCLFRLCRGEKAVAK